MCIRDSIQSVDQNRAIKTVKRTITELDRSKIEEQKKAIRAGYDIDIIPSDLATYGRDAKALLKGNTQTNAKTSVINFFIQSHSFVKFRFACSIKFILFAFKLAGGEQHFMLFADGKSTRDSRFSGARGCSHLDGTK